MLVLNDSRSNTHDSRHATERRSRKHQHLQCRTHTHTQTQATRTVSGGAFGSKGGGVLLADTTCRPSRGLPGWLTNTSALDARGGMRGFCSCCCNCRPCSLCCSCWGSCCIWPRLASVVPPPCGWLGRGGPVLFVCVYVCVCVCVLDVCSVCTTGHLV